MTYYRLLSTHIGEQVRILPNGYFERMDEDGNFDESNFSEHLESCFGVDIYRCLYGIGNWLQESEYYIYETNTPPCLNLDKPTNPLDYQLSGEVRYRKPVEANLVGKIKVPKEAKLHNQRIGSSIQSGEVKPLKTLLQEISELKNIVEMQTIEQLPNEEPMPIRSKWKAGELVFCDYGQFAEQCVVAEVYSLPSGDVLLLWGNEGYVWMDATESYLMTETTNESTYLLDKEHCPPGLLLNSENTQTTSL